MPCQSCNREVKQFRKGFCGACYARMKRNGTPEYSQVNRRLGIRKCSFCSSEQGPFVKTLCKACYYRDKKNGTLDYVKVQKFCSVPGCDAISVAHGLCDMHRKRVDRNGSLNSSRPPDWGAKSPHPMYEAWVSMRRGSKRSGGTDPAWDDFWKFIEDVGERPTKEHRLYRKDRSLPYEKDNVEWREKILDIPVNTREASNSYQRAYRLRYPDRAKNSDLKKFYGISLEQFNAMAEQQGHTCAICNKPEGAIDPYTKKPRSLALDHCHKTSKVRGLLCTNCNSALGRLHDDIDLFHKAVAYLEKYRD